MRHENEDDSESGWITVKSRTASSKQNDGEPTAIRHVRQALNSARGITLEQARLLAELLRKDYEVLKLNDKIKTVQKLIDECFVKANTDWSNIDLHGMSPVGATEFVKMVYEKAKKGRIKIITGAGNKSANNVSVIRMAVTNFLSENNISFSDVTFGSLLVRKK